MNNLYFDLGKIALIVVLFFWLYKRMEPLQIVKTVKIIFIILVASITILLIFGWLAMQEPPLENYFPVSFIDFVFLLVLVNSFLVLRKNKVKVEKHLKT